MMAVRAQDTKVSAWPVSEDLDSGGEQRQHDRGRGKHRADRANGLVVAAPPSSTRVRRSAATAISA